MNHTDITLLLDRSGSMASIQKDMEGGIKNFIDKQKQITGDKCTITVYQFDSLYDKLVNTVDIHSCPEIKISPRGSTALNDSMYKCIVETGERLAAMPEQDRPGKVIFLCITDGEENCSREVTGEKLKELISQQENVYNWMFMYLGCNQDAIGVANKIGVSAGKALTYGNDTASISNTYGVLNEKFTSFRSMSKEEFTLSNACGDIYNESDREKAQL